MIECPVNHPALPALFDPMIPDHPALWAVLKGRHSGRVMVDNVEHPTQCVMRTDAALTYSSRKIGQVFLHEAITHFQKVGPLWLIWQPAMPAHTIAPQADQIVDRLEFYDYDPHSAVLTELRRCLPAGFELRPVDGQQIISPLQGFGQMWQKTYRVRLPGLSMSAKQVMDTWKAEFPKFQPSATRFYPPMTGVEPGKVIFIDLDLPPAPGMPDMIPVSSGVMVLYADDEMFTVMTPEGFPVAGWNTFSVHEEDGCLVAQIQSLDRATDPVYELGTLFLGGARRQEENWFYVLDHLSVRFGIKGQVQMHKELVDPRWQWSGAKNTWKNAVFRTVLYRLASPVRWVRRLFDKRVHVRGS